MRKVVLVIGLCLVVGALAAWALQVPPAQPAQAPAAAARQIRVIGEVVAADAESRLMSVKTDSGETYTFVFEDQSTYLQVPPGEKTLDKAVPVALADIVRGDRVYGRGQPLTDGRTIPVQQLIVMSQAAITKKHDSDREDWERRGILGTVVEVKARTREVVLQSRARGGPGAITVQVADSTRFRRYAADSVKFADAKVSSLAEIKAGDQVRALGERSADGTSYKAEQVVSGSFRTTAGTVLSVTPESNEIKLKSFPGGETVTVVINKDSVLRMMPKEFAAALAQRAMTFRFEGAGAGRPGFGAGGGPMGQRPSAASSEAQAPPRSPATGAPSHAGTPDTAGGAPGSSPAANGRRLGLGAGGETRRGSEDLLERLPPATLAEIKPGDVISVFSTAGKNPSRLTAIACVSGIEPLLAAMPREMPQRAGRGQGVTLGMPGSALDMGMGLP